MQPQVSYHHHHPLSPGKPFKLPSLVPPLRNTSSHQLHFLIWMLSFHGSHLLWTFSLTRFCPYFNFRWGVHPFPHLWHFGATTPKGGQLVWKRNHCKPLAHFQADSTEWGSFHFQSYHSRTISWDDHCQWHWQPGSTCSCLHHDLLFFRLEHISRVPLPGCIHIKGKKTQH